MWHKYTMTKKFLSTPSARRATGVDRLAVHDPDSFYPRPPRGGRRNIVKNASFEGEVSIHALREEGDENG